MSNPKIQFYDKAPYHVRIVKYTCGVCFRRWQSANGNLEDYQICKNCFSKCYPGEYKWQAPNKKGNQNQETFIAHNSELCGKCIRLGVSCMELRDEDTTPGIVVMNDDGEDFLLESSSDLSSFIVVKEKTDKKKKKVGDKKMNKSEQERQAWHDLMNAEKKVKENKVKKAETNEGKNKKIVIVEPKKLKENKEKSGQEIKDNDIPYYVSLVLMIIKAARENGATDIGKDSAPSQENNVASLVIPKLTDLKI